MKDTSVRNDKKESRFGTECSGFRTEWNKIIWPERTQAMAKTGAVIVSSLAAGTVIALWDALIQHIVNIIA